jgi:heme/copper-type cytochrome/quinol oxidase subunit 2
MLIWILLGVIGLAAYMFWKFGGDEQPPATPEPPHVRVHQYYR